MDEFIKMNVEPRYQTSFIGKADHVSAQFILSRLVDAISIPKVSLEEAPFVNPTEMTQAIEAAYNEIKTNRKGFFVAHKEGFSSVLHSLAQKLVDSGRCKMLTDEKVV